MRIALTIHHLGWSLTKTVSLPDTVLHIGNVIVLEMGKQGIEVNCVLVSEKPLKENSDLAGWVAQITFAGPGGRVVGGGKNFVDDDELFAKLQERGWK